MINRKSNLDLIIKMNLKDRTPAETITSKFSHPLLEDNSAVRPLTDLASFISYHKRLQGRATDPDKPNIFLKGSLKCSRLKLITYN